MLRRGRWRLITNSLRNDGSFPCHKTTKFDDDTGEPYPGTGLQCTGALEWQEKHNGQVGQLARIMMRIRGEDEGSGGT